MLSAIYIKGFKTFARPVRMPLEGGVTAIVGPNGSGKSNITDAVLFALGEQSPGVLRAGAMSELIFSGSETLPGASAAEVTLVLDNASGRISLPYREVSITRRISRGGETEYRINGSRARLADVREVAGEAGLGRHSILRQGAVDAIVAGGAAACRHALEEAAGLGVYRRRRLSASRRLEKAGAQLEQSRQLEAELATQLHRIESEAAAAREYRELEARYRELSLAHLYRVATRELEGLRRGLEGQRSRSAELSARARVLGGKEDALGLRLRDLEASLREDERRLEALEDATEELLAEAHRAETILLRLEAGRGREGEHRRLLSRLKSEMHRVSRVVARLEEEVVALEDEDEARREESVRLQRALALARERASASEERRAQLAAELEGLRVRLAGSAPVDEGSMLSEEHLALLVSLGAKLELAVDHALRERLDSLRERLRAHLGQVEQHAAELSRRRGSLAAAIGRVESRVRTLRSAAPAGAGTRLYEVIRARPGYEVAVEAALGECGAGVLAENLDEGMKLISSTERVALRLDAQRVAANGAPSGKPLLECVEVLDLRYAGSVERLLDGIYVIESPAESAHVNGYVVVTRDGIRLTRTSISLPSSWGAFEREARLSAELAHLDALKKGPGEVLYDLGEGVSGASRSLERLATGAHALSSLADRISRARDLLRRETERRRTSAMTARRELERRERVAMALSREASRVEASLDEARQSADLATGDLAATAAEADDARAAAGESGRRLTRLRAAVADGVSRKERILRELERARGASGRPAGEEISRRAARVSARLVVVARDRRNALRRIRSERADALRRLSDVRTSLAHQAAQLAGEIAAARTQEERLAEALDRAQASARDAAQEIRIEWGATLEDARHQAQKHPESTDPERQTLARKIKHFGDVNLLALAQEQQLRERYQFVAAQRADAQAATEDLHRIIQSIDREIEARFSETFERVREAFGGMVPRMMAGASGVLELSEEGVEIGLRLGRRGWRPLRVLSGGERALLALSFLFSIFLSRPGSVLGAFCVLDEAEAALDDVNLARFLAVVDSHRMEGQYVLVTHQKRTMAAADVLYGVVQDASGATTVVSKRMQGE